MTYAFPRIRSRFPGGPRLMGLGDDGDLPETSAISTDLNALLNVGGVLDPSQYSLTPSALRQIETSPTLDDATLASILGNPSSYIGGSAPATSSGSLSASQIAALISGGSSAAVNLLKSTQSPYLIPGTNIIANPGGTPIVGSSVGTTASQVVSSLTSGLSSMLPIILIVIVAGMMMSKK